MTQNSASFFLIIEELGDRPLTSLRALKHKPDCAGVIHTRYENGRLRVVLNESPVCPDMDDMDCVSFYKQIFDSPNSPDFIYRLRNPVYPLPEIWIDELEGEKYLHAGYVLSENEAFGLEKFFLEKISRKAFMCLEEERELTLLPNGSFNGLILPDSKKHWFSPALQRYYLADNFDSLFSSPRALVINTVSGCNYKCLKCPFHAHDAPRTATEFMPVDMFKRILEHCAPYKRLTTIAPTLTGEPLLHPHLADMVKCARNAGYAFSFTTNAALLTEEMAAKLIKAGVGPLAFSVDAASPETYRRLQGQTGHALERIERNILCFQEMYARENGYFTGTVSFVLSSENGHERDEYLDKWLGRGFNVSFYARHEWRDRMRPHKTWLEDRPPRSPCLAAWHTLFLDGNLNSVTCSLGSSRYSSEGAANIFAQKNPLDFWRSLPIFQNYRQRRPFTFPWCGHCTNWAEMRQNLKRINGGKLVSEGFGSRTWFAA